MTAPRHMNGRNAGREGYILVAVLSVMLLLTGLVAAGSVVVRSALNSAKVSDDDVAMSGLIRSGVEIAAYQLAVMKIAPHLVDGRPIRLTDGIVVPHVSDEAGKIDLNNADEAVLGSVFRSVGMDSATAAEVVARIVAMRGPASNLSATTTGVPLTQQTGPVAPPPRRRGIESLDALASLPDVTRADMRALAGMLTVYNPDGKINLLSASRDVLSALPDMTERSVAAVLAKRDSIQPDAVQGLQAELGEAARFTKVEAGPVYRVRVDATSNQGRKKVVEVVLAASKTPSAPFYILDWQD